MTALRILLVCDDIPWPALGGLGKHVVALGNALLAQGHQVTLMGRDDPPYASCEAETGFHGRFITGCGNPIAGWKEGPLQLYNPWKRPYLARRIAQAILARAAEFDVVHYHGHLPMVGRYLPASLNFLQTRHDQGSDCLTHTRFRHGAVCHETDPAACAGCAHPAPGPLRRAIGGMAVQRYRHETAQAFARHTTVFVSDFLRRQCQRTLPAEALARAVVVHNFCDERSLAVAPPSATLAASPNTSAAPAPRTVHIAGRLDASKGIVALLDLLRPRLPAGWQVNVFGDGPLRAAAQAAHAGPQVSFHGHQPLPQVLQATASAQAVVVPSVWEEPCGTVILEALRLGRPCFALNRGGTPELRRYGAPGQLRLFDALPDLVTSLLGELDRLQPQWGGESADVLARLPELLALYRRGLPPTAGAAA